jgi:indole-3-glycerol phosphate synthase
MSAMTGVLGAIVAAARTSAHYRAEATGAAVERRAAAQRLDAAAFGHALDGDGIRIIAECKRRSPSVGILRRDYDAAAIAAGYERAGAAAISVLTEPAFFDGSLADLERVAGAVRVPVLRKDFVVSEFQLLEARACGAAAALLIVAALDDGELRTLIRCARDLDLAALVEVHDTVELDRALAAGASIVGVNSRDLKTLTVSPEVFDTIAAAMPAEVIAVAESGIRSGGDIARLRRLGYRGFLIGERFMASADPAAALAQLTADAHEALA